ncbi:hypothetical protein OG384_20465 [Streptomyces sp. NBC_01324]|uniref:hypothetical protein n=1 Tax=Streptomyces sp. NBC_01324 TaxID=2903826 RepID=UPI002E0E0419|nr:hypothetical protein OG384_20465 [Streptomyces sp. NBC_01324]
MSSSDQQHPYPDQPYGQEPHPYGNQPYGQEPQPYGQEPQAYGNQPYADQSYADQSYADQSYAGQGYPDPAYGQQQPYGEPSYGQQAPYPGEAAPYAPQAPQAPQGTYEPPQAAPQPYRAAHPTHQSVQHPYEPQQPQRPYEPQQAQQSYEPQQAPQAQQPYRDPQAGEPAVAQTWEGQTWDTQYQPTLRPAQQPAQPVQQAQPAQGASGAYPLPPEVRAAPAAPEPVAASVDAAQDDDGYSAPTTLGNSRITDAQRARAEGRSPIIAPGMQPAAITAGLGLLLALGAAIGSYALLVPLVLLQAVTAAGWFRLNGMWPARQGIALAFAGGLVADVVLLAAGRENGPAAILGTLGVWVLLTVVLQLRSRAGADERMQGLMATVASAALAVLAAGHLAAVPDAVTVGGVAVALAVLARALPLPGPASVVAALVVAAAAGGAAGAVTDLGAKGALLGLAAGGCALIGLRVASYDYPSRFVHMTAGVALPLTAAAPAVYLIGRAIG